MYKDFHSDTRVARDVSTDRIVMKEVFLRQSCVQGCMSIVVKSWQRKQSLVAAWYRECLLCTFAPTLSHKTKSLWVIHLFILHCHCISSCFFISQVLESLSSTEPPEMPIVSAVVILLTEEKSMFERREVLKLFAKRTVWVEFVTGWMDG